MWALCGYMLLFMGLNFNVRHSNTYNPGRLIKDECQMCSDRPGDHMEMFELLLYFL